MAETRAEQIARWERQAESVGPEPDCPFNHAPHPCSQHVRSSMSVVDEDRLTRRNSQHLDDWRFR